MRHDPAHHWLEHEGMLSVRFILLSAAGLAAAGGLAAGIVCLLDGSIAQAVAVTWPGLAGGVAFALAAPGGPGDTA
ncbi:MAG: hypothetical protein LAT81_01785 [Oceanicaulis sp.]|nr:hypothetical protein [Oceanicaulis sp.]